MALNINGTTGISGVDGSASAPALTGTDSNTGINFASDTVNINTGGTTKASISNVGKLTLTSTETANSNPVVLNASGQAYFQVITPNSTIGGVKFGDTDDDDVGAIKYGHGNNSMRFDVNASERMRISSDGALSIGSTSSSGRFLHVAAPTASSSQSVFIDSDNGSIANAFGVKIECSGEQAFALNNGSIVVQNVDAVGGNNRNAQIGRFLNGSGSAVGVILMNDSTTSYSTSSDYRLKENQTSISDGITRLKQLKPYRFNWKTNPSVKVDGFFAHEVSAVVPESIFGEKDATDSQGNPNYQSMDHSKLVPLLTAALQEAVAKIEILETKVAALEAA